ncbi:integrase arm-type DNA-binding domain-containing protein [Brucella pseudogrignonensis]|uniref:tyrosine-type recombinase/integrase n=1 Tax=Brucella pseudogrignonensis TaxID=419475 RepID=UPI001E2CEC64|nr:integrase arm-type DNA-binding domain-containing protein [Brucella pseudogrignonensis]MCD4512795.1 integrase arm-type DNA-binding domain-containing protein [Brucella pseudogrignonensis]
MALTDTAIKALKPKDKPYKKADSDGLYLRVYPNGSKLWQMAYRFAAKEKSLSFGSYPTVTLAEARKKRDAAKKIIAEGADPGLQAKLAKIAIKTRSDNSFNAIADEFIGKAKREGLAAVTLKKKEWLLSLARPDIGNRPIAEITAAEILIPLRKVEAEGNYETARRLRSTIGQVFRYAIATARAENDPTFGLRGALTTPTVTHRAAITTKGDLAVLLKAIWAYEGQPDTVNALKLMAYLYPRPGELRQAEWAEFDLDAATWEIPASRTKMRRAHKKPLPVQAVNVLRDQEQLTGDGILVFPAFHTRKRPMSENTMNMALRRMGFSQQEATSHGFRATASSLLNETGKWNADAIEAELAHVGADQVRNSYHRATYWSERQSMQQAWADECDAIRDGTNIMTIFA